MEGELDQPKEEKESLEASGISHGDLRVVSSVSGLSKGASAEPHTPKMKRNIKQKRHPGLPSQEGQETFKSHLAHL